MSENESILLLLGAPWPASISAIATVVAAVAAMAVLFQARGIRISLEREAISRLYDRSHALRAAVLQHPELRKFFYGNAARPTDEELLSKLDTLSDMFFDFFELVLDEKPHIGVMKFSQWDEQLGMIFDRSPTLQVFLKRNEALYGTEVILFFKNRDALSHLGDDQ